MGSFARSASLVLIVWLGVAFAACGGGGGGGAPNPNPNPGAKTPVDIEIPSTAALDGWCSAQGHTSTTGGLLVGDLDASWDGLGYRSFLSFDLSAIPAGATITYARLDVYKVQTFGSPFTHHGNVMAYQVDYGDTIEMADFNSSGLFGTILSESVVPGWRTCPQLGAVQHAWLVGGGRVQFRIQCRDMDSDADQIDDGFWFEDSENFWLSGHAPTLRVTYTPP